MAFPLTLNDKIAFVTGSTRGIGWATAQMLAQHGATVIVNGRDQDVTEARAAELTEQFGSPSRAIAFDASDASAIRDCYKAIFSAYKRLDILVANAGIMRNSLLGMITEESIHETFNINTVSVILHIQEASRIMARGKSGSIINLASIVGQAGAEGQIVYSASKAALAGITRSAAKELAPKGIRVNAVAPGMIQTELLTALPETKRQERLLSIRMGRFGEAGEVAKTIVFLASDYSSYVTGQILGVDGGMVL